MMKSKLNKNEVKGLIKEVLQERWTDIFSRKKRRKRISNKRSVQKFPLYHELSKWESDFLDDNGIYVGPEFPTLDYAVYNQFKRGKPLGHPGSEEMLQTAMKWNDALGELYTLPYKTVATANQDMSTTYYSEHADRILGFQS